MNDITMKLNADDLILMALKEDITSEDISTNAVMPEKKKGTVELLCKQDGVIAGLDVFARVFTLLDDETETEFFVKDGDSVKKGQLLGHVTGDIRVLLSGERTALNFLQRMSGIATYTRQIADMLEGSHTKLLDTRKTTPNHIGAAGSITKVVAMAKAYAPFVRKIEIETENLAQVQEAVEAGADIIMLDNMTPEMMKEAVALIGGRAQTECSGNVTKENVERLVALGVDYISSGALTHSAPILDLSLKNMRYNTSLRMNN